MRSFWSATRIWRLVNEINHGELRSSFPLRRKNPKLTWLPTRCSWQRSCKWHRAWAPEPSPIFLQTSGQHESSCRRPRLGISPTNQVTNDTKVLPDRWHQRSQRWRVVTRSAVEVFNFAARGNVALFLSKRLANIKRFLYKNTGNGSLRRNSDLQTWLYSFFWTAPLQRELQFTWEVSTRWKVTGLYDRLRGCKVGKNIAYYHLEYIYIWIIAGYVDGFLGSLSRSLTFLASTNFSVLYLQLSSQTNPFPIPNKPHWYGIHQSLPNICTCSSLRVRAISFGSIFGARSRATRWNLRFTFATREWHKYYATTTHILWRRRSWRLGEGHRPEERGPRLSNRRVRRTASRSLQTPSYPAYSVIFERTVHGVRYRPIFAETWLVNRDYTHDESEGKNDG